MLKRNELSSNEKAWRNLKCILLSEKEPVWKGCVLLLLFSRSVVSLCDPMDCSTPGFPVLHYLPEFAQMFIELVMPSNHLILCCPLLLSPSIFPSIRVFSNESVLWIRWPKYWCFTFNTSPSNKHSGLISFRMDWLHLFAVQGTLKSLLQHHSSKASVLQCFHNQRLWDSQ